MLKFIIPNGETDPGTPTLKLTDEDGDVNIRATWPDGHTEIILYINTNGVARMWVTDETVRRLQAAGFDVENNKLAG